MIENKQIVPRVRPIIPKNFFESVDDFGHRRGTEPRFEQHATQGIVNTGPCGPPGPPSALAVVTNSGGTVVLSWAAASGSPTSYIVEAGSSPGLTNLANSDLGRTTTLTATCVGSGTYYVRIRAKNGCGISAPSNEVRLVVQAVSRIIFNFDAAVSPADQSWIREGIDIGQSFFASRFQWTTTRDITVNVFSGSGPGAASAGNGSIQIWLGHRDWGFQSRYARPKILVHELFHVMQGDIGWAGALWLLEGSAEYVGYQAVFVDRGVLSADQMRRCLQFSVDNSNPPISVLSGLEGAALYDIAGRGAAAYQFVALATEQAISIPGIYSLRVFGESTRGRDWHDAFQVAFGKSADSLYRTFEDYRRTWQAPAQDPCIR